MWLEQHRQAMLLLIWAIRLQADTLVIYIYGCLNKLFFSRGHIVHMLNLYMEYQQYIVMLYLDTAVISNVELEEIGKVTATLVPLFLIP